MTSDEIDRIEPALPVPAEILSPVPSSTYSFQLPDGDSPEAIRQRVKILMGVTERCYMHLAHELWKCYHRQLYIDFGHDTFDDYVTDEVGISRDRAHKLRRIYAVLHLKCQIPTKEIEEAERSRVELILGVVDRTNAREWLSRAKSLPYKSLQNELATERNRRAPAADPTPTPPLTPEPTPPIKVACESPRAVAPTAEARFVKRSFRLPEDGDSLVTEALGVAQRFTKSHSDAFNLICVAQQFLAHNLTLEGKKDPRKEFWLRWMEEIYGGHFIHIKDDEGWEILRQAIEDPKHAHHLGTRKRSDLNGSHDNDRDRHCHEPVRDIGNEAEGVDIFGHRLQEAGSEADQLQAGVGDGDGP